mgnify:CR=1 FL=1|jgi:hypothetical protein
MIDPTPTLSRDYSRLIEAPGVTQDEIDFKAAEILRGLSALDVSDALHDDFEDLRDCIVANVRVDAIGDLVQQRILDYCQRIARLVLEA